MEASPSDSIKELANYRSRDVIFTGNVGREADEARRHETRFVPTVLSKLSPCL